MFLCPVDEIKETSTIRPITNWMMEDEPGEEYFSDSVGDYVDDRPHLHGIGFRRANLNR